MRAGAGKGDSERLGQLAQLGAALAEQHGGLLESLAAAGADLDLGRDQLADEMRLERGALRGGLQLFESVRERERLGVEDGELLLHGNGEVVRLLELLSSEGELLLGSEALRVSHSTTLETVSNAGPLR